MRVTSARAQLRLLIMLCTVNKELLVSLLHLQCNESQKQKEQFTNM